ncbi:MAG TPA: hypothetical protein VME17_04095 [Bryobacteraceae bacterium]|nr:hypothetical protein [Bryobacteraceae bacterium]
MTVNTAVFTCSICGEPSAEICAYCTKDACANHRCVRCKRCSDCCECEFPLSAEEVGTEEAPAPVPEPAHEPQAYAEAAGSDFAATVTPADLEQPESSAPDATGGPHEDASDDPVVGPLE